MFLLDIRGYSFIIVLVTITVEPNFANFLKITAFVLNNVLIEITVYLLFIVLIDVTS